jgi:hypothetical protein
MGREHDGRDRLGRFLPGRMKTGGRKRGVPDKRKLAEATVLKLGDLVTLEIRRALNERKVTRAIRLIEAAAHLAK